MSGTLPAATSSLDEMADLIATSISEELFPTRMSDVDFRDEVTEYVRCAVRTIAAISEGQAGIVPAARAPQFGRWLAEQGRPVSAVRDAYWLALRQVLDQWAARRWTWPDTTTGVPVDEVTQFTTAAFDFTERGIALAVAAHEEATAVLRRSGDLRRRDLVAEILADDASAYSADRDTALGYRLAETHVAVVIDTADRDRADEVLRRAQTASGAANRLLVPLDPPGWTAWLGSPERIDLRALRDVLAATGLRTAVGGPRRGVDGFRRAHAEARRAEELRRLLAVSDDCLVFADFALDSVLLKDVAAARAFAEDQLGDLAADTVRAERMRETLLAWLSTGSQTTAAARLGIHLNSLRLRLASAAEVLGPDYPEHRTELLVALRIRRALGRGTSPVDGS
ncbi:PucR family transcriptional regulator [Umezawaea sp. NPDC059074]|uniref:PucR family transcriptional regulator n=1 Tax=Umezawaea sp. NPDC059074 TaxID=3346716 RepID=UPI0036910D0D